MTERTYTLIIIRNAEDGVTVQTSTFSGWYGETAGDHYFREAKGAKRVDAAYLYDGNSLRASYKKEEGTE